MRPLVRRRLFALAALAWGTLAQAQAFSLVEAFQDAQRVDREFLASQYEAEATGLNPRIARGALLPSLNLSATRTSNTGDRDTLTPSGSISEPLDYTARSVSLNLRQPLLNAEALIRYRQSQNQAGYATLLLEGRRIELATRVARAYFEALLAQDNVELVSAEIVATEEQLRHTNRRLQAGEGTQTEVAEAEARRDQAEARRLDAENRRQVTRTEIASLTGRPNFQLRTLPDGEVALPLAPAALDDWLALARSNNVNIRTRQLELDDAEFDLKRQRAAHLPRIDFVASVSDGRNESVTSLNIENHVKTYGVQLSLPLFAGGQVVASSDQAVLNRERRRELLEGEIVTTEAGTRKQYLETTSAGPRMTAYQKAVRSSQEAATGSERAYRSGFRTNLDVLQAKSALFTARRDLAQARYTYLLGVVNLKALAGTLTTEDLAAIDRLLVDQRPTAASDPGALPLSIRPVRNDPLPAATPESTR